MNNIEIIQLGHPTLRKVAVEVTDILSDENQQLINDLVTTVEHAHGLGIAAPQINCSKRLFIMASKPNIRYPNAPFMPITAIINPKLISSSESHIKDWEGCLSLPGIRGLVPRPESINVSYYTADGEFHQKQLDGFLARVFLHELDHLDGKVFIDRVESTQDIMMDSEWRKQYIS